MKLVLKPVASFLVSI